MDSIRDAIKNVYGLDLRIHNVKLEFGMQLNRFLAMIKTEEVHIDVHGVCEIVDIKLTSESYSDSVDTAEKIQTFSKVKNYMVIIK